MGARALFFVEPKLSYASKVELDSVRDELAKYKETRDPDKQIIKGLEEAVEKARTAWRLEKSTNVLKKKNLAFTEILYGQTVQLLHSSSGRYLASNSQRVSKADPFALDLELTSRATPDNYWKIFPRYAFRSVGAKVKRGDHIELVHVITGHAIEVGPKLAELEGGDVVNTLDHVVRLRKGSPSAAVIQALDTLSEANLVKSGDVVRLRHTALPDLVMSLNLQRPFWMPNAKSKDIMRSRDMVFSSFKNSVLELFEIQSVHTGAARGTGNQLKYGQSRFTLLHLASKKYLAVSETDHNKYELHDSPSIASEFAFEPLDETGPDVKYQHLLRLVAIHAKHRHYLGTLAPPRQLQWEPVDKRSEHTARYSNHQLKQLDPYNESHAVSTRAYTGGIIRTAIAIDTGAQTNGHCEDIFIGVRDASGKTIYATGSGRVVIDGESSVVHELAFGVGAVVHLTVNLWARRIMWQIVYKTGACSPEVTRDFPALLKSTEFKVYARLGRVESGISFLPSPRTTKTPIIFSKQAQFHDVLFLQPTTTEEQSDLDRVAQISKAILELSTTKEEVKKSSKKTKQRKNEGVLGDPDSEQSTKEEIKPPGFIRQPLLPQQVAQITEEVKKLKNYFNDSDCKWGTVQEKRAVLLDLWVPDLLFRILTELFEIEAQEWDTSNSEGGSDGFIGTARRKFIEVLDPKNQTRKTMCEGIYEVLRLLASRNKRMANHCVEYFNVIFGQIPFRVGAKRLATEVFSTDIDIISSLELSTISALMKNFEDQNEVPTLRFQDDRSWEIVTRLCYSGNNPIPRNQREVLELFEHAETRLFIPVKNSKGDVKVLTGKEERNLEDFMTIKLNQASESKQFELRGSVLHHQDVEPNDALEMNVLSNTTSPKSKKKKDQPEEELETLEEFIKRVNPTRVDMEWDKNNSSEVDIDSDHRYHMVERTPKSTGGLLWSVVRSKHPLNTINSNKNNNSANRNTKKDEEDDEEPSPDVFMWTYHVEYIDKGDPNTWKVCVGISDFVGKQIKEGDSKSWNGGFGNAWGLELGGCSLITGSPYTFTQTGRSDSRFQGKLSRGLDLTVVLDKKNHTMSFFWNEQRIAVRHENLMSDVFWPFISMSQGSHSIGLLISSSARKDNRRRLDWERNKKLIFVEPDYNNGVIISCEKDQPKAPRLGWASIKCKNGYKEGTHSWTVMLDSISEDDKNKFKLCLGVVDGSGEAAPTVTPSWYGYNQVAWGLSVGTTQALIASHDNPVLAEIVEDVQIPWKVGVVIRVTLNLSVMPNKMNFEFRHGSKEWIPLKKIDFQVTGSQFHPFLSFSGNASVIFSLNDKRSSSSQKSISSQEETEENEEEEENEEDDLEFYDEEEEDFDDFYDEDYESYYDESYDEDESSDSAEEDEKEQKAAPIADPNEVYRKYFLGSLQWMYGVSLANHEFFSRAVRIARSKKTKLRDFIRFEALPAIFLIKPDDLASDSNATITGSARPAPNRTQSRGFLHVAANALNPFASSAKQDTRVLDPNIRAAYTDLFRLYLEQTAPNQDNGTQLLWAEKQETQTPQVDVVKSKGEWEAIKTFFEHHISAFREQLNAKKFSEVPFTIALLGLLRKILLAGFLHANNFSSNFLPEVAQLLRPDLMLPTLADPMLPDLFFAVMELIELWNVTMHNAALKHILSNRESRSAIATARDNFLRIPSGLDSTLVKFLTCPHADVQTAALNLLFNIARPYNTLFKAIKRITVITYEPLSRLYNVLNDSCKELRHLISDNDISREDQPEIAMLLKKIIQHSCWNDPQKPNLGAQFILEKLEVHQLMFKLLGLVRLNRAKPVFILCYWVLRLFATDNRKNQERLFEFFPRMLDDLRFAIGSQLAIEQTLKGNLKLIERVTPQQVDLIMQSLGDNQKISYAMLLHALVSVQVPKLQNLVADSFLKYALAQAAPPFTNPNDSACSRGPSFKLPLEDTISLKEIAKLDTSAAPLDDEHPFDPARETSDDPLVLPKVEHTRFLFHAMIIEFLNKMIQNNFGLAQRFSQLSSFSVSHLQEVIESKLPARLIKGYAELVNNIYMSNQSISGTSEKKFIPIVEYFLTKLRKFARDVAKGEDSYRMRLQQVKQDGLVLFHAGLPFIRDFVARYGDHTTAIQGSPHIAEQLFHPESGSVMVIKAANFQFDNLQVRQMILTFVEKELMNPQEANQLTDKFPVTMGVSNNKNHEDDTNNNEPDHPTSDSPESEFEELRSLTLEDLQDPKKCYQFPGTVDVRAKSAEFEQLVEKFQEPLANEAETAPDLISQLEGSQKRRGDSDLQILTLKVLTFLLNEDEENSGEFDLSQRLAHKYQSSTSFKVIQKRLGDFRALQVAFELISSKSNQVVSYAAEFGTRVLTTNTTPQFQLQLVQYLQESDFFHDAFRVISKYRQRMENELSVALPMRKDHMIPLLRLLQSMCESHNTTMKNLMRDQHDPEAVSVTKQSINLPRIVATLSNTIYYNWNAWAEGRVFQRHLTWAKCGSTSEPLDLHLETCFELAAQAWATLTEFATGCPENQVELIHINSIRPMAWYLSPDFTNACKDPNLFQRKLEKDSTFDPEMQGLDLQTLAIKYLLSLVEGLTGIEPPDSNDTVPRNLMINIPWDQIKQTMALYFNAIQGKAASSFANPQYKRNVETFLTNCLILMQILSPFSPSPTLLEEPLKDYQDFYNLHVGVIEVVSKDKLQTVYFKIPQSCLNGVDEDSKIRVLNGLNRDTPAEKVSDFLNASDELEVEIQHRAQLSRGSISNCVTSTGLWKFLLSILTIAINILLIVTYTTNSLDTDEVLDPEPAIPIAIFALGSLHSFFATLFIIGFLWVRLPIVFATRKVLAAKTERLKNLAANKQASQASPEDEEEKKKVKVAQTATLEEDQQLDQQLVQARYYLGTVNKISSLYKKGEKIFYDALEVAFTYFDANTIWFIIYWFTSIIATIAAPPLFSLHLLDISIQDPRVRTVLQAVTKNGRSLLLTALLGLIVIYEFSVIGFFFLRADYAEVNLSCETLAQCLLTTFSFGIRSGIGDVLEARQFDEFDYGIRYVFDLAFYIIVVIILLNVIFGIILDTFSELRSERESILHDNNTRCLICSLPNEEFQLREGAGGFESHIKKDHNIWKYLYFFVYLDSIDQDEYNAVEWDVNQLRLRNDTSFFPLGRSIRLKKEEDDSEVLKKDIEEIKASVKRRD